MICNSCPRKCDIDRKNTLGFCQSPERFRLARAALHFWEEPCISGTNGSGTVFFSGCNLRCVYCQNYEISHDNKGREVSDDELVVIFENLVSQGAHNINLVNPSHYAKQLARVLTQWNSPVPIVYNTSGYDSADTLKMLDGLVDIYLTDFKYIRADKAAKYSKAGDYPEIVKAAIAEMRHQLPHDEFDENGIMKKGIIVRHLILPQNTNSSVEIIDHLANNYPNTYLSLMAQYTPYGNLESTPELSRKITEREYDKVVNHALSKGLENIFIQDMTSADKKFIPAFDFTGIM
ncbi:MAG: radical SAM protein [Eubacterium sp.]|nr:radical SAM protein [Eubacterium sp.]